MYEIYINNNLLRLEEVEGNIEQIISEDKLTVHYNGKVKQLHNYIDMLEKTQRFNEILIWGKQGQGLYKDFFGLYKEVSAAGGIVFNKKNKILVIYRRSMWDLPKGKIDDGESIEQAAIREVIEETGIKNIELKEKIGISYHTYKSKKGKRILKPTHWFKMYSEDVNLIPEGEEGIEKAIWIALDEFLEGEYTTYNSLLNVLSWL